MCVCAWVCVAGGAPAGLLFGQPTLRSDRALTPSLTRLAVLTPPMDERPDTMEDASDSLLPRSRVEPAPAPGWCTLQLAVDSRLGAGLRLTLCAGANSPNLGSQSKYLAEAEAEGHTVRKTGPKVPNRT